jgi:hypothetical protein
MKNIINKTLLTGLALLAALVFTTCQEEEPGKYEMTGGVPVIYYVRPPSAKAADSLLTSAYTGNPICLVGDNLTSIKELYFNDLKAILNINFITKNTLLVNVPKDIPAEVTNKIYMVTGAGQKVDYDFKVMMPPPSIQRIKCEQVSAGEEAVLFGDYFLNDDPSKPLSVSIGGYTIPNEDILDIQKTQITFIAPAGDVKGLVSVITAYGSARSKDIFRDDRGLITGFEDGFTGGWGRPAHIEEDPEYARWGKYVRLSGDLAAGAWTAGGNDYTINIWGEDNGVPSGNLFAADPATAILKFEANVLETWSAIPMIFCFYAQGGQEGYLWEDGNADGGGAPRGVWVPWLETGAYASTGWETVAIPLSSFKYNGAGAEVPLSTAFGALGISVHNRGNAAWNGADCSPVILIDNVRVIPGE